jgi:peroxiredoxin
MKSVITLIAMMFYLTGNVDAKSLSIGDSAPSLRLTNISGKTIDTGLLKGSTVVIYFWNDRCGCVEQLLQLRNFINGLKDRPNTFPLAFLTVNEGQSKEVVKAFFQQHGLAYEALLDTDLKTGKNIFGVKVLPTIIIIDKWGVMREKVIGVIGYKKLTEIISRYL